MLFDFLIILFDFNRFRCEIKAKNKFLKFLLEHYHNFSCIFCWFAERNFSCFYKVTCEKFSACQSSLILISSMHFLFYKMFIKTKVISTEEFFSNLSCDHSLFPNFGFQYFYKLEFFCEILIYRFLNFRTIESTMSSLSYRTGLIFFHY